MGMVMGRINPACVSTTPACLNAAQFRLSPEVNIDVKLDSETQAIQVRHTLPWDVSTGFLPYTRI